MKGVRKLAPYLRPYYKTIAVMVILGVFSSLADSIYPLFTSYALDTFVAGKTLRGIVPFSLLYLLLMAVTEAVNYYCLYKCGVVEMKVDRDLRNASFNHLQTLSFSYFNQNNVGYIHARVMSDTGKIGELVAWRLMDFVWEASYILFVIVMMLAINVRLAAWTLLIFPAGVLIITYFQRRLVEGNRKIREINSTITGNFNEGITGARSIRTLVIEKLMQRDFDAEPTITAVDINSNGTPEMAVSSAKSNDNALPLPIAGPQQLQPGTFISEPSAPYMKSALFRTIAACTGTTLLHPDTHLFWSKEKPEKFPGRTFQLVGIIPFDKRSLSALVKTQANLSVRNFPESAPQLQSRLKLRDGGPRYLIATTLADSRRILLDLKK